MKFVLTPVGTSVFNNFIDDHVDGGQLKNLYANVRQEPESRWSEVQPYVEDTLSLRSFRRWIRRTVDASAEMASTSKITRRIDEPCEVHLLASDTVASRLAAELIASEAEVDEVTFQFDPDSDVIRGLRVDDADAFVGGMRSLIKRLRSLLQAHSAEQTIMNITGGYKATLPYLTLMAQLNDVPLLYKFEETDALLSVPQAPIKADLELIKEYEGLVDQLDEGIENWPAFQDEHYAFYEKAEGLIHTDGEIALLSPLGEILWQRYQEEFAHYYATDEVEARIQDHPDIQRILRDKFDALLTDRKVEQKNGHYQYDDGDNQNRIYFFRENGDIYIYQVFEDHDAAEAYIRTALPDRDELKKEAERRRIRTS
jgi:CRISPR/Cas system-associated protein Csm6